MCEGAGKERTRDKGNKEDGQAESEEKDDNNKRETLNLPRRRCVSVWRRGPRETCQVGLWRGGVT